jgi:hypothetical protein
MLYFMNRENVAHPQKADKLRFVQQYHTPFNFTKEGTRKNIPTQAKTDSTEFPGTWGPIIRVSPGHGLVPYVATQDSNYVFISWSSDSPKGYLYLARSTNGGESFEIRNLTDTVRFPRRIAASMVVADRKYLYLFFIPYNARGIGDSPAYVMRSGDHGETFDSAYAITDMNFPSGNEMSACVKGDTIVFVEPGAFDKNNIFVSKNGGKTWKIVKTFRAKKKEILSARIVAISEKALHMVFSRRSKKFSRTEIFYRRSLTLGKSWKSEKLLSSNDTYGSMDGHITASQNGDVYVGWRDAKYGSFNGFSGSFIYRKSSDAGKTWFPEEVLTEQPEMLPAYQPIAVSRYTNNPVAACWTADTAGMFGPTTNHIKARISTDSAKTWHKDIILSPDSLYSVEPNTAVSPNSVIVAYNDGGKPDSSGFYMVLRVARLHPQKNQEHNTVSVPEQTAQLLQNYPNPFNPATNFSFVLRYSSIVTLKIYDVLGREVAILLQNEKRSEGKYTVPFDASQLSSGTYFSRLFVETIFEDRYAEVKKIVVVR